MSVEEAFRECIKRNPDKPPSPADINRLAHPNTSNMHTLNGKDNAVRKRLMAEHGFVKDWNKNRWVRP